MAAEKTEKSTTKRKQKAGGGEASALKLTSDPRKERRFEPKAGATAIVSVVALSVGAVILGAGTYAQWLRAEALGPHPQAQWMLLAGALMLIAVAVFGPRAATPLRVGDAGIGVEKDGGDIERIEWRDVARVLVGGGAVTVESPGTTLTVPFKLHPEAAARILHEARLRVAGKLDEVPTEGLPEYDPRAGEVKTLEEAQVAGAHCKASDRQIAFEKDARLCGKCGEIYHKEAVPPKCLTCDAKLK
jgi:hypothetical protein